MVQIYFRGNDFATIKFFGKSFHENLWFEIIPEEMILQSKKFRLKKFDENFWFKPIPEEMTATIKKFSSKNV